MHINTAIRRYVEALLQTTATAGENVYVWPRSPVPPDDLPAIVISTGDAVAHQEQTIGDSQTRILQNTTQIIAGVSFPKDSDSEVDVQDTIDQIQLEIERAFHIDQKFGGLIDGLQFVGSETELTSESELKIGRCALTHIFTLTTDRTNPEAQS